MEDDTVDTTAAGIGAVIQRGVELLAQQSVEMPTFKLANVADLYHEGVCMVKSRAPAARVLHTDARTRRQPTGNHTCQRPGAYGRSNEAHRHAAPKVPRTGGTRHIHD